MLRKKGPFIGAFFIVSIYQSMHIRSLLLSLEIGGFKTVIPIDRNAVVNQGGCICSNIVVSEGF